MMFGGYARGGGHIHGGGGAGLPTLLLQLQAANNPTSDAFDPEMRTHQCVEYLSQISERLSLVQNEGELSGLRVSELCRTLVSLLGDQGDSPDLMLLAARCMCNLMEALPGSGSILVETSGCLEQLLALLMNISFIDVAEQAVLTLQKISRERAPSVLKAGGLAALLTFIEFFPTSVQRVCIQTAGALLLRVPADCMELVLQSIPLVLQKLESKQGLEETIHTAIITYFVRVVRAVTSAPAPTPAAASTPSSAAKPAGVCWLSHLEVSGLVRAVVDLLRHALKEPSLFSSTALPQLTSILVSLTRKSSVITEELLDGRHNIVPLIEEIYVHVTGGTVTDTAEPTASSSSLQLPAATPQLHSSPSKRASHSVAGSTATAATAQQLNPLLSLAMELLPDLRTRPAPPSTTPHANSSNESAALLSRSQQLLEQISRAMHGSGAPPASAAASSPFSLAPTPSSASAPSAASQSVADRLNQQLTFLTPLLESSVSVSPEAPLDPSRANDEALAMAAEDREALGNGEDIDDEDSGGEEIEPPVPQQVSAPTTAAAAADTRSALHAAKARFLLRHPAVLHAYVRTVLPLFMQAASSSNDSHMKYKCVSGVLRILCVSETASILDAQLFPLSALSSFVHTTLQSQDPTIVAAALQLMDLLMQKAGDVFGGQFFREGCVETVQDIADNGVSQTGVKRAAAALGAAASTPSAVAPALVLVQQRAKLLLATHFADSDEPDQDVSMGEDRAQPSTPTSASAAGSPAKRRRFSSCATAIFKQAQELGAELQTLMEKHSQIAQKLHQDKSTADATLELQASIDETEKAISVCLTSISACLVGGSTASADAAPGTNSPASTTGDTLTTHEFLHSGLLDGLLAFLFNPATAAKVPADDAIVPSTSTPDVWQPTWTDDQVWRELALQRRQRLFGHVFFGLPKGAVPQEGDAAASPPSAAPSSDLGDLLVTKLIEALESIDPIHPTSSGVSPAAALKMISQPFRVRLIYRPRKGKPVQPTTTTAEEATHMEDDMPILKSRSSSIAEESSPMSTPLRRSTRSMTAGASPAAAAASPSPATSSKTRSTSKSPAGRPKKGFFSSAIAAIKRVGSGGSSGPAAAAAANASAAAAAATAAAAAASAAVMAANFAQLYPMRQVHIDTLANFQSIEVFLGDSVSLVDLYEKTERVKAGLSPHKTALELENELAAANAAAEPPAPAVTRASSSKKKKGPTAKEMAAAAAAAAIMAAPPAVDPDHIKLLDGIRTAHLDAQPIRVEFRFAKKPPIAAPTPYQSYSSLRAAAPAAAAAQEEEDEQWHDISLDRNLSVFEAVQAYHQLGIAYKGPQTPAIGATPAPAARAFSAFEMFHACYDIEFRLTRDPAPTAAPSTSVAVTKRSATPPTRSYSRASRSRSTSPHRKNSVGEAKAETKAAALTEVTGADLAQAASGRLARYLQQSLQTSSKSLPTLASLLLLLDSVHHLSHHWATLYSSWPALVEFFAANDSCGNGTTGRGVALPPALISSGAVSSSSLCLPYSHSFASPKLSRQLQMQCEDPIVVLGSVMPAWVDALVQRFPFLFHFSSRELLFRVTAFHPARHLLAIHNHMMQSQPQLMQAQNGRGGGNGGGGDGGGGGSRGVASAMLDEAASSDDEESGAGPRRNGDIGTVEMQNRRLSLSQMQQLDPGSEESALQPVDRVAQLKVRVHRDAVLHAAKQLFISHTATRRGAIRAEFHGEEAVGIGPTLEFFTLVSQQLQLKSLRVWNKDTIKPKPIANIASAVTAIVAATTGASPSAVPMDESTSAAASSDMAAMDLDDPASTAAATAPTPSSTPTPDDGTARKRKRRSSDAHPVASATPRSPLLEGESKRAKSHEAPPSASASSVLTLRGSSSPPHLHNATSSRLGEFFDLCVIQCPSCLVVEVPFCEQHQQYLTVREEGGNWHCAGELPAAPVETKPAEDKKKGKKASSKKKKGTAAEPEEPTSVAASASTPTSTSTSAPPTRLPCFTSTNTISGACVHCAELAQSGGLPAPAAAPATNGRSASLTASHGSPTTPRRELKHWRLHAEEVAYVMDSYPKNAVCLSHIILQCSVCLCINFPGYRPSSYGVADTSHGMLTTNKGGHMVTCTNAVVQEKAYRSVTRHATFSCDGLQLAYVPTILTQRGVIDVLTRCQERTPRFAKKKRATSKSEIVTPGAQPQQEVDEEEEKEVSITRTQPSPPTPSGDAQAIITRAESALPPPMNRTVSASTTTPAATAFEEPTSQFVTSSSLYPPPTVQRVSNDTTQEPGIAPASLEWGWLVGRFLGQALMETRLLDLPFSQTLLKQLTRPNLCLERKYPPTAVCRRGGLELVLPRIDHQQAPASLLEQASAIPPPPPSLILPLLTDMLELAPHLAKPLMKLLAISYHQYSPRLFPLPSALLTVDGASIDYLDFDFTLPGHPEIELVPEGASVTVTPANVHIWLWLVARQLLCEGVLVQLHCIHQGLKQVMEPTRLQPFFPHELEELVSGGGSVGSKLLAWDWSVPKLRSAIKYRQGYHPESPAILNLLTIMAELTPKQQRQFTRFITGSPSLPGGQIAALSPPLTVVKIDLQDDASHQQQHGRTAHGAIRVSDGSSVAAPVDALPLDPSLSSFVSANYPLPSVMTCSHYLKLPNYPTLDIMREKVMIAITEGSTGFTLS